MSDERAALATLVRRERKRRGWSQEELAAAAGVSASMVSSLERRLHTAQGENARAILTALGLDGPKPEPATTAPDPDSRDWPHDVAIVVDVVGVVLSAIPEGEDRTNAIRGLTRYVMSLPRTVGNG